MLSFILCLGFKAVQKRSEIFPKTENDKEYLI